MVSLLLNPAMIAYIFVLLSTELFCWENAIKNIGEYLDNYYNAKFIF